MKIVFIGCVNFSRTLLERVLSLDEAEVVGVVTKERSEYNADFCSLVPLAEQAQLPVLIATGKHDDALPAFLAKHQPDAGYCFGWPHLLMDSALRVPKLGVVGYHPTALPKNRGRHPIIWTLALGLTQTASTFFLMDKGADSGDILSQSMLPVSNLDTASTLYAKLEATAIRQIEDLTKTLAAGRIVRQPQDSSAATYWRKRTAQDGAIDWRLAAETIYNIVRALTHPYPGAHFVHAGKEIRVWRASLASHPGEAIANAEPGKILDVGETCFDVRCGIGALRVFEHEPRLAHLKKGGYL